MDAFNLKTTACNRNAIKAGYTKHATVVESCLVLVSSREKERKRPPDLPKAWF